MSKHPKRTVMTTNYEVNINGFSYDVDYEITADGVDVLSAIEPFEDGSHRETTQAEKLAIKWELDEKFKAEIEAEKAQSLFDNFCERADNFRESKY